MIAHEPIHLYECTCEDGQAWLWWVRLVVLDSRKNKFMCPTDTDKIGSNLGDIARFEVFLITQKCTQ